jgi:hypothetical protein
MNLGEISVKLSKLALAVALASFASLFSGAAIATPAAPPTAPLSDQFTIYNPNGSIEESLSVYEDGSTWLIHPVIGTGPDPFNSGEGLACPGTSCYGIGWGWGNAALAGNPLLFLYDGKSVSDYLGIYIDKCCSGGSFYFASDTETSSVFGPGFDVGCVVVGNLCDITWMLSSDAIQAGYRATFYSEGDVPEPITVSLFGAGLMGAIAVRRRKRMHK